MPRSAEGTPKRAQRSSDAAARWRRGILGAESRWPAFVAVLAVIVGQLRVASSLRLQPVWLLPGVAGVLLLVSVAIYVSPVEPGPVPRAFSIGLAAVLVLTNLISLGWLVRGVFLGSGLAPFNLLGTGVALWAVNVFVFAIVYWELDGGGPDARIDRLREHPDLVFPQQQADQGELASPDWQPSFGDYLFVALTNGTAFSPTDTMPYTRRAKFVMGVQSTLSFAIAALLVARAVNIAQG